MLPILPFLDLDLEFDSHRLRTGFVGTPSDNGCSRVAEGVRVIVLSGTGPSGEDIHTVAATVFDDWRVADYLPQESIEIQQFIDFALPAQTRGELPVIESCRLAESDPPDLWVNTRGRDYGVELTSISTPELARQRLSEVRAIGRHLAERIKSEPQRFSHLVGTRVILQELASDNRRPPRAHGHAMDAVIARLVDALGPEIGVVDGAPLLPPGSPPGTTVPFERAMRGRAWVDGNTYLLEVHPLDHADAPTNIVANCQAELVSSELIDALVARIRRKYRAGTEFLLITTGLPDRTGYLCPADAFVFELIRQLMKAGRIELPPLRYLKQVVLNHWHNPQWTLVLVDNGGLLKREFPY
jgi:hypothetical protein